MEQPKPPCGMVEAVSAERCAVAVRCVDGTWLYARAVSGPLPREGDTVRCDLCGKATVLWVLAGSAPRELPLDNAINGLPGPVARELLAGKG